MLETLKRSVVSPDPIVRKITFSQFINTFGNGLFHTVGIIYFSLTLGFGPHKVALTFAIGAAFSLALSIPAGHLADKYSPRNLVIWGFVFQGIFFAIQAFNDNWYIFTLFYVLESIADRLGNNARMAVIARIAEGEERLRARAYTRAVVNLGIGIGTMVAGFALAINTVNGYKVMILLNALTFFVAAIAYSKVPKVEPSLASDEKFDFAIFKEKKFIAAAALNGGMVFHFIVQSTIIPLWVVKETNAPRWWISVIMVINTAAIVLFQVRVSQGTSGIAGGVKHFKNAGLFIGLACMFYALSQGPNTYFASLLLVIAMAIHVVGELLSSNGSWAIAFELADQNKQGLYQGVWSMGFGSAEVIAPSILVALIIGQGQIGWIILGIWFVAIGYGMQLLLKNQIK